jgi:hypothetical protein
MCAKIVSLVRKGGMRERWAKNGLFYDIQSYHSARGEFRLAKVAFEEGYLPVSRIELTTMRRAMVFRCVPGTQPVRKRARECTLSRIFLSLYQKDRRFGKASCFMCGGQRCCRKSSFPGWWHLKGAHTTHRIDYLGCHE